MKRIFLLLFIGILCIQYSFPGTKADVISKSGQWLTINKGSKDGIKIGMTGIVKTIIVENGKPYDINVGFFTIKKVKAKTSEAYITKLAPGMNVEQSKYVVFSQVLKPTSGVKDSTVPTGKPVDWYLDKGDEYLEKGQYPTAKKYYQKVLDLESFNPIAKEKIKECDSLLNQSEEEQKYYNLLKRADNYLKKGNVQYALEYYLTAYKLVPSKSRSTAYKFKEVSESNPGEWEKFKNKHSSELKSILDKYFIPPGMPEEVYKVKSKAKKVYKNEKGYWEAEFDYGIVMIYVPEGEFWMGSNEGNNDEKPVHSVYLDGCWIGKYEVTQRQWKAVMIKKHSFFNKGDNNPVEMVSWDLVKQFIQKLNSIMGLSFRLPTEAEWEKAARGTDLRKYPWGNRVPSCNLANYRNCGHKTKPFNSHPQGISPYGAYNMAGNVSEWCSDRYSGSYYSHSPRNNPTGSSNGTYRVIRGGGQYLRHGVFNVGSLRCAYRDWSVPGTMGSHLGFRLCMD